MGHGVADRVEVGGEAGAGGDDREVDAGRPVAGGSDPVDDIREEDRAGHTRRGRRSGREDPTQVAEAGGPQQGVGEGVEGDVAVRMTVQSGAASDLDPSEGEGRPRAEGVAVVTDANARPAPGLDERLGAHLDPIRDAVAHLLTLPPEAVNVKASTGNLAGMEGAGRGISAEAIAQLESLG